MAQLHQKDSINVGYTIISHPRDAVFNIPSGEAQELCVGPGARAPDVFRISSRQAHVME